MLNRKPIAINNDGTNVETDSIILDFHVNKSIVDVGTSAYVPGGYHTLLADWFSVDGDLTVDGDLILI